MRLFGRIPYVGRPLERLIVAVRLYRHKLAGASDGGLDEPVAVHSLFVTGIYLIARGLPGTSLSYSLTFCRWPR